MPRACVRVPERAVEGRATAAALTAVAAASGVRPHGVALVSGAASRMEIADVTGCRWCEARPAQSGQGGMGWQDVLRG
jgi:hypothetical protein